jgi:hypothetical protein
MAGHEIDEKEAGKQHDSASKDSKWEEMYTSLIQYKEENGDTLVPNRFPKLGSWVSTQRRYFKDSRLGKETPLTQQRIEKLERIGFIWEAKDSRHIPWDRRYQELVEYHTRYGNCLVPNNYSENMQLAIWVSTQRQEYKLWKEERPCRITNEQINLLSDIGFSFEPPRGGYRTRKRSQEADDAICKSRKSSILVDNEKKRVKTPFIPRSKTAVANDVGTLPWIKLFKEFVWYTDNQKDMSQNTILNTWYKEQNKQYKLWKQDPSLSELDQERINLLSSAGFSWDENSPAGDAKKKSQEKNTVINDHGHTDSSTPCETPDIQVSENESR